MSDDDEWRRDVEGMNDLERQIAVDEPRRARGLVGDKEDARDE